jgi:hypothetical protein
MNSWKLNGVAGHLARRAIVKGLNITFCQLYKTVKTVTNENVIITQDGSKYCLTLTKIE